MKTSQADKGSDFSRKDCMTEDAQSATGFGGQLRYVVCPRRITADGKVHMFE